VWNANPLASIGSRFTAQFIDGLVAIAFGVATYVVARSFAWPLEWLFVAWLLYILFCDALPKGQSLGKRFTNIAVVHAATGKPCTVWRSFVRNISLVVLGVFDLVLLVGRSRRRLGDYLAGTKVVELPQ